MHCSASPSIRPTSLLEQLAGEHGLQRALRRVLPNDGSQLLLLIDQFEELFTQVDPATANRFLDTLVSAVTDDQSRIRVIATLRADYYDRPLQHRGLGELLRDGTEAIPPMTPHELERAITGPVRAATASRSSRCSWPSWSETSSTVPVRCRCCSTR